MFFSERNYFDLDKVISPFYELNEDIYAECCILGNLTSNCERRNFQIVESFINFTQKQGLLSLTPGWNMLT